MHVSISKGYSRRRVPPIASRVMCLATLPRDLLFLVVAAVAATGEECDVAALRAVVVEGGGGWWWRVVEGDRGNNHNEHKLRISP